MSSQPSTNGEAFVSLPSPSNPIDSVSRLTPSSLDGYAPTRLSSRLRKEEVFDFNAPVLLNESIEDKSVAEDEVLSQMGFALCEGDTLWCHPHALFNCKAPQSKDDLYCKWRRDTLLRCSITTEIIVKRDSGEPLRDLEPLGSLYHPRCVNVACRWDGGKLYRTIMRLEKGELVTRQMSKKEVDALAFRAKGSWFGKYQDINYPLPLDIKPFSRDPTDPPDKKRKITFIRSGIGLNTAEHGIASGSTQLPYSPLSQPPTPAQKKIRKRQDRPQVKTRPSTPQTTPAAAEEGPDPDVDDCIECHPNNDAETISDDEVEDGHMFHDVFFLPKKRYHERNTELKRLRVEVAEAKRLDREQRNDADEQAESSKRLREDLRMTKSDLSGVRASRLSLLVEVGALKEQLRAALDEAEAIRATLRQLVGIGGGNAT